MSKYRIQNDYVIGLLTGKVPNKHTPFGGARNKSNNPESNPDKFDAGARREWMEKEGLTNPKLEIDRSEFSKTKEEKSRLKKIKARHNEVLKQSKNSGEFNTNESTGELFSVLVRKYRTFPNL